MKKFIFCAVNQHFYKQSLNKIWKKKKNQAKAKYLLKIKNYVYMKDNKVDSIDTGHIVIAHLFPRSDHEYCLCITLFSITDDKISLPLLNL